MNVSVPVDLLDRIDDYAAGKGASRADVVRTLLVFALDNDALGDRAQLDLLAGEATP